MIQKRNFSNEFRRFTIFWPNATGFGLYEYRRHVLPIIENMIYNVFDLCDCRGWQPFSRAINSIHSIDGVWAMTAISCIEFVADMKLSNADAWLTYLARLQFQELVTLAGSILSFEN